MSLGYKVNWTGTKRYYEAGVFSDKRSRLDMKGHLHLKGKDVEPFRRMIFKRSDGICECSKDGVRCETWLYWPNGFEMHHSPDGYERYDSMESCFAFCRPCHRAVHVQVRLRSVPNV